MTNEAIVFDFNISQTQFLPALDYDPPDIEGVYSMDNFWNELQAQRYTKLDLISYTITPAINKLGIPIDRCIVQIAPKDIEGAMVVTGTHAKLYIGYKRNKPTAYIGSANAVNSQSLELLVKCTPQQSQALKTWFDKTWKRNKKLIT